MSRPEPARSRLAPLLLLLVVLPGLALVAPARAEAPAVARVAPPAVAAPAVAAAAGEKHGPALGLFEQKEVSTGLKLVLFFTGLALLPALVVSVRSLVIPVRPARSAYWASGSAL